MNVNCPACEQRFEVEPGFFIGAMYVSYAMTVGILITVGAIMFTFFNPELWTFLFSVALIILLLLPFIFRYSRILFLHWFGGIEFDPKYSN